MKLPGHLKVTCGIEGPYDPPYAEFREEQGSGSDAGTLTDGAWNVRALNTTAVNRIDGVSLGSNRVTVPAGIYYIEASAPGSRIGSHMVRVYDFTNSETIMYGTSENAPTGTTTTTRSFVGGRFEVTQTTGLEIQHYATSTTSTADGGDAANISGVNEVYTYMQLWQLKAS